MKKRNVRLLGEVLTYRPGLRTVEVKLIGVGVEPIFAKIEAFRLKAENLNYSGANFFYDVVDEGAHRTVDIRPNTAKNNGSARKLKKMIGKYVK